ncbi:MAG TPA: VWA domain-containing protein [Blastocatellia bacterium]|nr:VWA domain-containing protein [Blastocatellia bacterium]
MKMVSIIGLLILILSTSALSQNKPQLPGQDQPIRISTELVQLDVVVTDKNGHVVRGLTKDDFEIYERGKKQLISFFEFVDAVNGQRLSHTKNSIAGQSSSQGPLAADIHRIFAFVIDDLETRYSDMVYVRQMLTNFIENQMQPGDLVAIVRTLGGKGLLQQFTTDKELLRRAVASLTPITNRLNVFDSPTKEDQKSLTDPADLMQELANGIGGPGKNDGLSLSEDVKSLRAYMSLGTASFLVDSMRQLPGRKSMILVSSGLPILSANRGNVSGDVSVLLNSLTDKATRAGVTINTIDIRGLGAQKAVADFEYDPPGGSNSSTFGRLPDPIQFGFKNPFDTTEAHQGLRVLASQTGGIAILNKNNLEEGLGRIVNASNAYYLLAYTPSDSNFKGEFRNVEIKVKDKDLKVYSRRGYFAREEKPAATPATKQEQVLTAIHSPLVRQDVDFEARIIYRASQPDKGAIEIGLAINPKTLQFQEANGKQQASYEVVGFVFDELGKLRGGFSNTVNASLTPEEYNHAITGGGLGFTTGMTLPAGLYQLRLAVRDNKTEAIGTLSQYLEIPNLSNGGLAASSLMLGAVSPNEMKKEAIPLLVNGRISREQDLRYAVIIYNPKLKNGKPQVKTQLVIIQNGQVIYKEPEQMAQAGKNAAQTMAVGQLGLSRVKPGRYTAMLIITDTLAEKQSRTITRSMDFMVQD